MVYVCMERDRNSSKTLVFVFFSVFNIMKLLAILQVKVGKTVACQDHNLNTLLCLIVGGSDFKFLGKKHSSSFNIIGE